MQRKVLVFGVFDGLHEGHLAFLRDAKKCGDTLVVVLARDEIVKELKGSAPRMDFETRKTKLQEVKDVNGVVAGDKVLGSWDVLRVERPDVIALGYDQKALAHELQDYFRETGLHIDIEIMPAHKGETHHSRLLLKQKKSPVG